MITTHSAGRGLTWMVAALFAARLWGQDLSALPDWARKEAAAAASEAPPVGAQAWVVLDRTEIAYAGHGEVLEQRYRLVRVAGEKGVGTGTFYLMDAGGKTSKVKTLRGWNLRPDGEVTRVERGDAVVWEDPDGRATGVALANVVPGSWVAWQTRVVRKGVLGPFADMRPLQTHPVRRWELQVARKEGWFTDLKQVQVQFQLTGFKPWALEPALVPDQSVTLSRLPALAVEEGASPDYRNVVPRVVIRFLDPEPAQTPDYRKGWDSLSAWLLPAFQSEFVPFDTLPKGSDLDKLQALRGHVREQFTYRQFYLSPERSWMPEKPAETARKKYGDCKDLAAYFIAIARGSGFKAYPVLCRIEEGEIEEGEPLAPTAFNHCIAAVKLDRSLGLASEVETEAGRFLIVDLTERFQPLGMLGSFHAGRRMMVCTDQGARWFQFPAGQTARPRTRVNLQGAVDAAGTLTGTLRVTETGDAFGLRSTAQEGSEESMKERLLKGLLNLPPTASLQVLAQGRPMDVEKPFELSFRVNWPRAFQARGGEGILPDLLFPGVPGQIQKAGTARQLPVESRPGMLGEWSGEVQFPGALQPVLPELRIDSALRRLEWRVQASTAAGGGTVVRWSLENQRRQALFAVPDQDKGLQAWKKDRTEMRRLREEAMAFKVGQAAP